MPKKMIIMPQGQEMTIYPEETILDATTRAGLRLPFSCKGGVCGACKGKILSGDTWQGAHSATALTDKEQQEGFVLFCCTTAKTDIVIEGTDLGSIEDIPVKTLPCRVQAIDKVSNDVAVLSLKLPNNTYFPFLAGQYIDMLMKDGTKRSFSLANPPHDNTYLQLHIRHVPGGEFSEYVFNHIQEKEILRFTGPLGTFFLREESDKPIIFIASGTGFAPIKGIIEHALHKGIQREMIFYWGARTYADLYMFDLPVKWQQHPHFTFIPVLSEPTENEGWQGRKGLVHEAVLHDFQDLSHWQIYASGAPAMVEAAHATCIMQGLPEKEFFSDAFFLAKDLSKNTNKL